MLLLPSQAPAGGGKALGSKTCSGALGLMLACTDAAAPLPLCALAASECAMGTDHAGLVAGPA